MYIIIVSISDFTPNYYNYSGIWKQKGLKILKVKLCGHKDENE